MSSRELAPIPTDVVVTRVVAADRTREHASGKGMERLSCEQVSARNPTRAVTIVRANWTQLAVCAAGLCSARLARETHGDLSHGRSDR